MPGGMPTRGTTEDIGIHGIMIHSGTADGTAAHTGDGTTRGTAHGEAIGTMTITTGTTIITITAPDIRIRSREVLHSGMAAHRYTSVQEARATDWQAAPARR